MIELIRSALMARQRSLPSARMWRWPTNSASVCGRIRVAKGSGVTVTELNTMMNKFGQMQQMMKKMGKFQKMMGKMGGGLPGMLGRR